MLDPKKYKDIVYRIIGAAMEVHCELNWGLLEPVYNEALHLELLDRGIENEREQQVPCYYKNHQLEKHYQLDIVVGDVIVELKSVSELNSSHRAQLFNYLRLTKKPLVCLSTSARKVYKVSVMHMTKKLTNASYLTRT